MSKRNSRYTVYGIDIMLWYVDHHGPCTSQRASTATLRWIYSSPFPAFRLPLFLLLSRHDYVYHPFLHSLFPPLPCKLYSNKNICFNQLISASMENMAPWRCPCIWNAFCYGNCDCRHALNRVSFHKSYFPPFFSEYNTIVIRLKLTMHCTIAINRKQKCRCNRVLSAILLRLNFSDFLFFYFIYIYIFFFYIF